MFFLWSSSTYNCKFIVLIRSYRSPRICTSLSGFFNLRFFHERFIFFFSCLFADGYLCSISIRCLAIFWGALILSSGFFHHDFQVFQSISGSRIVSSRLVTSNSMTNSHWHCRDLNQALNFAISISFLYREKNRIYSLTHNV